LLNTLTLVTKNP